RSFFIDLSVSSQVACALLEIAIASERLTSAIRPAQYYQRGRTGLILYPITVLVVCIAVLQGYITEVSNHFLAAVVILCTDLCTITVNSVSVMYCKNQFEKMHGKATLNARYQVREAHEVATSMQQSYLVCFFCKNEHNCIPLVFFSYYIIEIIYCMVASCVLFSPFHNFAQGISTTSTFLLFSLVRNHPRLKTKTVLFLSKIT
ncbi:hypothetical protein PENTCL1PPCAC_16692, partial [Pristionchus entomophagus]